jgi:hypothetical protein
MRPKWDERHFADGQTYGTATIEKVLKRLHTSYRETSSEMSVRGLSRMIVEVV